MWCVDDGSDGGSSCWSGGAVKVVQLVGDERICDGLCEDVGGWWWLNDSDGVMWEWQWLLCLCLVVMMKVLCRKEDDGGWWWRI